MTNDDVSDLYERVGVGAKVVVLPASSGVQANNATRPYAQERLPSNARPVSQLQGPSVIRASELY